MRELRLKVMFRDFPEDRLVVINGGFREKQSTELWLVPVGTCVPPPTLKINSIRFRGTRRTPIPYDCC